MFNIFKKKKMINEITNTQVTEMLANYAISLLQKGIDYETFDNLTCTFGYCIKGVDGNYEALYKITTDKCVAYFQASEEKVVRLNLNEEKYLWGVNFFFNNNPQIKNRNPHTMFLNKNQ